MKKKKIIIHKFDGETGGYMCNWLTHAHHDKMSWQWKNVTCKNCLKYKRDKK